MKERNLGKSGLRVSTIGLGCNNLGGRIDLEASRRVVHKAWDLGITLFDVADVYGGLGGGHLGPPRSASARFWASAVRRSCLPRNSVCR